MKFPEDYNKEDLKDKEVIFDTSSAVSFSDMLGKMIYSNSK